MVIQMICVLNIHECLKKLNCILLLLIDICFVGRGFEAMCQNNFSEAYQLFRSAVQEEPENTAVSSIASRDFSYCNQPNKHNVWITFLFKILQLILKTV